MRSGSESTKFLLDHIVIFCRRLAETGCNALENPVTAQLAKKVSKDYNRYLSNLHSKSGDEITKRKTLAQRIETLSKSVNFNLPTEILAEITHHITNDETALHGLLDKDEEWHDFLERLNTQSIEIESIASQSTIITESIKWGPMTFYEKMTPPTKSTYTKIQEMQSSSKTIMNVSEINHDGSTEENHKDDQLRIDALDQFSLGETHFKEKKYSKQFYQTAHQALSTIENKINEDWLIMANSALKISLHDRNDEYAWLHDAVECFQQANPTSRFDSAIELSQIVADFQFVIHYLQQASAKNDDFWRLLAMVQTRYASFHQTQRNFGDAAAVFLDATKSVDNIVNKTNADWENIANIYHDLCEVQLQADNDTVKMEEYVSNLMRIYNTFPISIIDNENMSVTLHNVAVSLKEKRELYHAEHYFRLSISYFKQSALKVFDSLEQTYSELSQLSAGPLKKLFQTAALFFSDKDLPPVQDFYSWMRAVENPTKKDTLEDLLALIQLMRAYGNECQYDFPEEYVEFLQSGSLSNYYHHLMNALHSLTNHRGIDDVIERLVEENNQLKQQIKRSREEKQDGNVGKTKQQKQESKYTDASEAQSFFSPKK